LKEPNSVHFNSRPLLYIEAEEGLFRGFGRCYPSLSWRNGSWLGLANQAEKPWGWGQLISEREAERLFPSSTRAALPPGVVCQMDMCTQDLIRYRPELFDGYDFAAIRLSPEEQAARRAQIVRHLPGHLRVLYEPK
jgi:hypothetical protein